MSGFSLGAIGRPRKPVVGKGTAASALTFVNASHPKGAIQLRFWPVFVCLALAACGPYPRDIDGTLDRIEREERLRVGFGELRPDDESQAHRLVARLAAATGARARIDAAPLETQLGRLEQGELDLVVGELRSDTPWRTAVTVIEPISSRVLGRHRLGLHLVAANGENRWIALLEREVRDAAERGS